MLRFLLDVWSAYSHRAATYQTRVLLTLVYMVILGPAALLGRGFGTRLMDMDSGPKSTWLTRAKPDKTLVALRRQF